MPAPLHGPLRPGVFRFRLGGFEVATLLDGMSVRAPLYPTFGGNTSADEVHALARANNIDTERLEHCYTPVLVNTGRELILFDTGNGHLARDIEAMRGRLPPGELLQRLSEAGYRPEEVDVIVTTHGHPDHIGGLVDQGKPVFPNARYVFGATEFDFWKKGENVREARKGNRELFVKRCVPLAEQSTFVKPGDEVVSGITAVEAFGHSPGLMAYHIESEGKRFMIVADTVTHYVMAIARPDWYFDMDDDKDRAVATRKRLLDMLATDRVMMTAYHMPFPGVGWIERAGTGYRYVAHGYQLNL